MRVADYLVRRLADMGVEHVFMLPGGGAMHLNDALTLEPRITPVPCHHEQACGIAAEACGRVQETFGVAMVTTGPGATNIITPVVGAWIESVPLLVISGQVKTADRLKGRPLRQTGVQEVDVVPMVRGCTKYAVTLEKAIDVRREFERAIHEMLSGRRGPVWIDVPLDIQGAQVDPDSLEPFVPPPSAAEVPSLSTAIDKVIGLLSAAERPLILAGHGIRLAGAASRFRELVERLGVPVVTTWNALDLLPWDHPLCVGRPGVVASRAPNFAVQNCDLLIAIGSRLDNVITAYNPRGFARGAKKVVVDVDQHELDKLDMDIAAAIPSDAAAFIDAMLAASLPQPRDIAPWLERCHSWKRRYEVSGSAPDRNTSPTIGHYQAIQAISKAAPPGTVFGTGSSGLAVEAFYVGVQNKEGQRIFKTSGLGSMGYGLPAAIGACLGSGGKPTICVEGDGSLMLNLQEFATLRGLSLPICVVILNNGGYCSIRNTQRNYFHSRFIGTDPEHRLWMPDLEKVAAVFELPFARITKPATLDADLQKAIELPRPCLVDMHLTTDEQLSPKAAALPQPDGSMLSMPLEDMSPLLTLEELKAEMILPLVAQSVAARDSSY
jgi:acetolactate synthase-1/2/3 large subunit